MKTKTVAKQDNESEGITRKVRTCFVCRTSIPEGIDVYVIRITGRVRHKDCARNPYEEPPYEGKGGAYHIGRDGRVIRGTNSL